MLLLSYLNLLGAEYSLGGNPSERIHNSISGIEKHLARANLEEVSKTTGREEGLASSRVLTSTLLYREWIRLWPR